MIRQDRSVLDAVSAQGARDQEPEGERVVIPAVIADAAPGDVDQGVHCPLSARTAPEVQHDVRVHARVPIANALIVVPEPRRHVPQLVQTMEEDSYSSRLPPPRA